MIHGPTVDLRRVEPDDLPALARWLSEAEVSGEFERFDQATPAEMAREVAGDVAWYIIQTKASIPVGYVNHGRASGRLWIGFTLVPEARGRGFASEAAQLLVDYLFLHEQVQRIQAETHPDNRASQRVLEKAGFQLEGRLRRTVFSRGRWRDTLMFSVLREEWREPRLLGPGAA
jgi:RimJ/RimL family protein N-acetyltransferase